MKKLALILAIAMIAAFSAPAFAELNIGGSYRMTATDTDSGVTGTDADESSNFQHRFRVPFTWTVNDNVTAFVRMDWNEDSMWGNGSMGDTDNIAMDYAWVKISQPMFDVILGAQEVFLGEGSAYDADQEGITFALKLDPVTITLAYGKMDEDGSKNDAGTNADEDSYAVEVKFAGDGFTVGGFYALNVDEEPAFDDEAAVFALFANANFGAVSVKGELDIFDGEQSATVDYEGFNLWADVSFKASDALTLGVAGYYAEGNDDADKEQISSVNTSGASFQMFDHRGPLMIDEAPELSWARAPFELVDEAGIQAIKVYADFKATDAITLHGQLGYAEPEQNINLDSRTYVYGSVDYAWMPNVTLSAGVAYITRDYDDNTNDDPTVQYLGRVGVSF